MKAVEAVASAFAISCIMKKKFRIRRITEIVDARRKTCQYSKGHDNNKFVFLGPFFKIIHVKIDEEE